MLLVALDDFDGVAEHLFGPVDQGARVSAVGEDGVEGVKPTEQSQ